jgi:P-type Cu+ transporter
VIRRTSDAPCLDLPVRLHRVVPAIELARRTMRIVEENLGWAFGYNLVLVPVAAGILYPVWGVQLSPILAGLAMALSSLSVVANSLRLRRFRPIAWGRE